MKKKLIFITAPIILLVIIGITYFIINSNENDQQLKAYTGSILSEFEEMTGNSSAFELATNNEGQPVFINNDKAFEKMKDTCKDAIEIIRNEGNLTKITKKNLDAYSSVGAQISDTNYNSNIMKEIKFICIFSDIYDNSKKD